MRVYKNEKYAINNVDKFYFHRNDLYGIECMKRELNYQCLHCQCNGFTGEIRKNDRQWKAKEASKIVWSKAKMNTTTERIKRKHSKASYMQIDRIGVHKVSMADFTRRSNRIQIVTSTCHWLSFFKWKFVGKS